MGEIFNASWPFVFLTLLDMVLMAVFPGIVTTLPRAIR